MISGGFSCNRCFNQIAREKRLQHRWSLHLKEVHSESVVFGEALTIGGVWIFNEVIQQQLFRLVLLVLLFFCLIKLYNRNIWMILWWMIPWWFIHMNDTTVNSISWKVKSFSFRFQKLPFGKGRQKQDNLTFKKHLHGCGWTFNTDIVR